jgi:hypothetical protein
LNLRSVGIGERGFARGSRGRHGDVYLKIVLDDSDTGDLAQPDRGQNLIAFA